MIRFGKFHSFSETNFRRIVVEGKTMIYFLRRLLFDHKTKQHLGWFDPRASYKKATTYGGSNKLVDNGFAKKHEIFFQRGKGFERKLVS